MNDPTKLVMVVANYTSKLSFTNCLPHLKGEEVFGSFKQPTNYPPSVDNDPHHLDRVNSSPPQLTIPTIELDIVDNVTPSSSNKLLPLVF